MSDKPQHDPVLVKLFTEALGCQFHGNPNGALIAYKRLQRQFPDFADAWINASSVLSEMERYEEAMDMALRALEIVPENPNAFCALANARKGLRDLNDAMVYFRRTLDYDPAHFPALTNLAEIYANRGIFQEALDLYSSAIQVQPHNSVAWENRATLRLWMLDMAGAETDFKQALELDENNVTARRFLGITYLLQYRYLEGWSVLKLIQPPRWSGIQNHFGKPIWDGEPLNGRTLLVNAEQHGFGDLIQFARFFPVLQQQYDCRILLSIREPLKRLSANLPGVERLVIAGEPLPPFDLVAPFMDLLVILNFDSSEIPPPCKFLPKSLSLPELDRPGFKIGLVWAASHVLRSINPNILDELADIPGVAWYGLQKPSPDKAPNLPGFIDMSPHMGDFMDTAQIAKQLDLIVTVDTSMAHLAGSLELPTLVILSHLPEWRWGFNEKTPWYPTISLLRQTAYGDWQETISLLKKWIVEFMAFRKI